MGTVGVVSACGQWGVGTRGSTPAGGTRRSGVRRKPYFALGLGWTPLLRWTISSSSGLWVIFRCVSAFGLNFLPRISALHRIISPFSYEYFSPG